MAPSPKKIKIAKTPKKTATLKNKIQANTQKFEDRLINEILGVSNTANEIFHHWSTSTQSVEYQLQNTLSPKSSNAPTKKLSHAHNKVKFETPSSSSKKLNQGKISKKDSAAVKFLKKRAQTVS